MPTRGVIQAGHLLGMVFVALLLVGARGFLGAHPALAGLLLAMFAPAYYVAGRITGQPLFLYPAVLLLVLAYHLLAYAAGVALSQQPFCLLAPLALIFLGALQGVPRIEGASRSLCGANNLLLGVFALWIFVRAPWFLSQAPLSTALALAGYGAYTWLRFVRTEKTSYVVATVILGSSGFLYFLYSHHQAAVVLGAATGLLAAGHLYYRGILPRPETLAFALVGAYLLFIGFAGPPEMQLPLGYLVLAAMWLHLALVLHRPELPPLFGSQPAPLPRLLPLFAAGIVLGLAPVALFYPWRPLALPVSYLAVFFVLFLATSLELAKYAFSLIGIAVARTLSWLARAASAAALVYLAWQRFPPSYRLGLAVLSLALLSLLAGWRHIPRLLVRRNMYVYQAGVFLALAYFLAERRLGPVAVLGTVLDSGALLVIAILAAGYALRTRAPRHYLQSLFEIAQVPATVACILYVWRGPVALGPALLLGGLLVAAGGLAFLKLRRPAVLFTLPVVLGLWIYVGEWLGGVRGELLGLPYLAFGFASAAAGYVLLRRRNRWYELFYFAWFLWVGVSLCLFYPYRVVGAYAAPLWPIAFLLVARGAESRRDFAFALALEVVSAVLAAASVAVLCFQGLYFPAAAALFLYALLYAWLAVGRRFWSYLYPAAGCLVGSYFLAVLGAEAPRLFLPYLFPLAAVLYVQAALLRRRGLAMQACPLELAAGVGAGVGALLFVTLPFGSLVTTGWTTGLVYLVLYLLLTRYTQNRVYLAGIGLAGAFAVYEFLPRLPAVTGGNRLAFFIPVALVLVLLGHWLQRARDARGGWGLYAAAIAVTVTSSLFALWPAPPAPVTTRIVLLVAMAVWLALLVWTQREIFIYCATLSLAMLAYSFVQSSADVFGQHLVAFFLAGTALLGLVFLAATARTLVRFRRPLLFVRPAHWYQRVLYLTPVAILAVATFGSWGVSTSSNPHFCGTCHTMKAYFANWKASAHARADVGCATCHYEPGMRGYVRAKMKGTSELVATLAGTGGFKPVAQVSDQTCLRSGCHSGEQLARPVAGRTFYFRHTAHLGRTGRGPELRCTSCHTSVGPETHFAVDTDACFTCHFQASSDPRPVAPVGCVGCHSVPGGARGSSRFDHVAAGVRAGDGACGSCHERVVQGSPAIQPRQCRHCHLERVATLLNAGGGAVHKRHVTEKGIGCDWCHGVVRHGGVDKQPLD